MEITLSDAPKYKQIMRILLAELEERSLEPHARFYSESELKERFRVSVPTIRMALKELIQEGVIYREHGKGTFISPRTVRHQVLIVGRFKESLPSREFGIVSFMQSLISDASHGELLMPVALNSPDFTEIASDLKHYYPNAKGVLFFRDFDVVLATQQQLKDNDIPYLFYGSDTAEEVLSDHPTCFYEEEKIVDIGLSYLVERFGEKIAFAYSPSTLVFKNRLRLYQEWMNRKGFQPRVLELPIADKLYDEELHEVAYHILGESEFEFRSLFCGDDRFALLFHNAALRRGLTVPDELSILGINDYPFCNMVYPSISSISIPLFDDGRRCLKALMNQSESGVISKPEPSAVKLIPRHSA